MDNPSLVAGIFRDQADADRAVLELQRAGMNADLPPGIILDQGIPARTHREKE